MSFLKNILGAFVELKDDKPTIENEGTSLEASAPEVPAAGISASVPPTQSTSVNQVNTPAVAPGTGSVTVGFQKHFEDLIEEANAKNPLFQGTDFKEFIESKSDVEAIADEPTKYRTAFNVLKRTGLTKERLATTGQEYMNIIDRDLTEFEKAFRQQYKTDVEHKEQLLQQKAQELQLMTEKISTLNKEINQMSQEIVQSKEKLGTNKNAFILAGENKKNEIKTELQKIAQYF
jgi:hypothetical protein